uniref:Uncharacterized protein TCIL3000_10_12980 n=1 Tax=Trypanosoma congolense (strain IL3000) TaxID=1068625 RepID=G0UYP9_TRYCI|nr:unnamed protein product [Trypanosoma congolense IL3000]
MASRGSAPAVRRQQLMKTADLVNKVVISTAQFLNRFAAYCESKLLETNRSLQRLETLTQLLEAKIASVDEEFKDSQPPAADADATVRALGDNTKRLMIPDRNAPPPMPGLSSNGAQWKAPPPPNAQKQRKGPPPPPGAAGSSGAPAAPVVPVPLLPLAPGQPPAGVIPVQPPPMPLMGGVPMRSHPRLAGYYQCLPSNPCRGNQEKMQSDGYQPEWLDTPDAPAPTSVPPRRKTQYDSD